MELYARVNFRLIICHSKYRGMQIVFVAPRIKLDHQICRLVMRKLTLNWVFRQFQGKLQGLILNLMTILYQNVQSYGSLCKLKQHKRRPCFYPITDSCFLGGGCKRNQFATVLQGYFEPYYPGNVDAYYYSPIDILVLYHSLHNTVKVLITA